MELGALIREIAARREAEERPIVIGISGYCGSGKSTLARELVAGLSGTVRIRGDDFLDPVRSHRRSSDWDGVERMRLVSEVLAPTRETRASTFRRYDWDRGKLGPPEPLPFADILVVDLIGLFHPDALPAIDLTVWCDVDLETAVRRGMERDARSGRDHDSLWREVWEPNERDFEQRFDPRAQARVVYSTAG